MYLTGRYMSRSYFEVCTWENKCSFDMYIPLRLSPPPPHAGRMDALTDVRQTDRQTYRQTDRQAHSHKHGTYLQIYPEGSRPRCKTRCFLS